MKTALLPKSYSCLTAEERFRLIMAASGRSDDVERNRLLRAGERIYLSFRDHAPYAHAFDDVSKIKFIEILEDVARFHEALDRSDEQELEEIENAKEVQPQHKKGTGPDESLWSRYFDLLLAAGYTLRTNVEGWNLFCAKLSIPPFLLWEILPGFDRLQDALALAKKAAFTPEGFLKWLNRIRPDGEPELTKVPVIAEEEAAGIEKAFRHLVRCWSGDSP
jgi:hypothetical protein